MELEVLWAKPSAVLRALTEARLLMANHDAELKDALDELIKSASHHIDEQLDDNPYKKAEDDKVRESAVQAARMVAKILISHGGDAAREALGVPPPNPLEQQKVRAVVVLDAEKITSELNSVVLEIDDDADHGPAGRHYRVSANLYLPVDLDEEGATRRLEAR
jgi:hypothetical protein